MSVSVSACVCVFYPAASRVLFWARAIRWSAGRLSPARLDRRGNGTRLTSPLGFITTGEGDGTGEGGVVTTVAGVTSVAMGTGRSACGASRLADRDGLSAEPEVRAELTLRAASDWAKSWAFLRGEAVLREMARPCGSCQSQLCRGAWPSVAERGGA